MLLTVRGGPGRGLRSLQERESEEQIRVSPGPSGFLCLSVAVPGECLWKGSPTPRAGWEEAKRGRGVGVGAGRAWGGSLQLQAAEGVASVFAPLECS